MMNEPASEQFDWKKELAALRARQAQHPEPQSNADPATQPSFMEDLRKRQRQRGVPEIVLETPQPAPRNTLELIKVSTIAVGAFGSVYRVYEPKLGLWLAQKSIPKTTVREHSELVMSEIKIHAWAVHKHVISLFHFYSDEHFVHLLMELVVGDNLAVCLPKHKPTLQQMKRITRQLLSALNFLHSNEIVHRDIKPENVLVLDDDYQMVKLCDFGFAYHRRRSGNECIGTVDYMAPQMVSGEHYGDKVDVWALGIILYQMLTGRPLHDTTDNAQKYYWLNNFKDENIDYTRIADAQARSFLKRCLCRDPQKRSTCIELLLHSWLIN